MISTKLDWKVEFLDSGREPKCPPDPNYLQGMHVDMSGGASRACQGLIPYPAPRCGQYLISCHTCKTLVMVTVAGRPDDVRSVKLACKLG